MEELNFLLGWLFRASNRLPDFVLQLEEDRSGVTMAWLNVEQSAPTAFGRLFRTSEDGQGSLLPSHCTRCECSHSIVVGPECLCSILKDYFG